MFVPRQSIACSRHGVAGRALDASAAEVVRRHAPRRSPLTARFCVGLAILCGGLAGSFGPLDTPATLAAQESRIWTDTTGQFKITGKLVSEENGEVTIRKVDGEEVVIPTSKLSKADQDYLKTKAAAENPFTKKPTASGSAAPGGTTSPAMRPSTTSKTATTAKTPTTTTKSAGTNSGTTTKASPAGSPRSTDSTKTTQTKPKVIVPDLKSVKMVKPITSTISWDLEFPKQTLLTTVPRRIPLDGLCAENGIERVVANPRCQLAVVTSNEMDHTREILVCNMATGTIVARETTTNPPLEALAISDDGTRIALRNTQASEKHVYVDVWTLAESGLRRDATFIPYANGRPGGIAAPCVWARFVGDELLATNSQDGTIAVWNLDTFKPKWALQQYSDQTPDLSPDGQFLACVLKETVLIVNVAQGRIVASQKLPILPIGGTAVFSPTNQRLAVLATGRMLVLNTADGKLITQSNGDLFSAFKEDINEATFNTIFTNIAWIDDHSFLNDGRSLISISDFSVQWSYPCSGKQAIPYGGLALFAASTLLSDAALITLKVPGPEVQRYETLLASRPELFALRPDGEVQLDLSGITDATKRNEIERHLTAQLAKNRIRVTPTAESTLVASLAPPKATEFAVNELFGPARKYPFQEVTGQLKLMWNDKPLWQHQFNNRPGVFLQPERNESIEQYLRRAEADTCGGFLRISLPQSVPKPSSERMPLERETWIRAKGLE